MIRATVFPHSASATMHDEKVNHNSFDKFRSFGYARFMNWRMNHHHHHTLSDEGRMVV